MGFRAVESRGYSRIVVIRPRTREPAPPGNRVQQKWRGARRSACHERRQGGDDMSLIEIDARANPLEVVERMAATNDWSFERANDDEITLLVRGKWSDYQVSF